MWILINMVNNITTQSHIRSSFACFECLDSAARVFFKDQREYVLSSLTFTPALQALFKVSHLRLYHAVYVWFLLSLTNSLLISHQWLSLTKQNRHMTSVWEERIDKLLWFPWGLERTSLCFECLCLMQWRGADEQGRRLRAVQEGLRAPTSW